MSNNYNNQLQTHNTKLQSIFNKINNLPDASDGGLDTSDATATASDILSGKTAYVNGSKIIGNIAFQAAKTITPSTVNQVAISKGYYASGSVTVKGDVNLVASNIKSGTSIFGVTGTYAGTGGESRAEQDAADMLANNLGHYHNNKVKSLRPYAFYTNYSTSYHLRAVTFPNCRDIGSHAFANCSLSTGRFGGSADYSYSFAQIFSSAFYGTYLTDLTLLYPFVANLYDKSGISMRTNGQIYVPASLVDTYKSATNWAAYSNKITALGTPITFKIDGAEYSAEAGMTWREWVNSEYNVQKNSGPISNWKIDEGDRGLEVGCVYADAYEDNTRWIYLIEDHTYGVYRQRDYNVIRDQRSYKQEMLNLDMPDVDWG